MNVLLRSAIVAGIALLGLPGTSIADESKDLAIKVVKEVCVPTLPDFQQAIQMSGEKTLLEPQDDEVALDYDNKVSMTVTDRQEIFGIVIEPLCVVNLLGHEAKELIDVTEALASELGGTFTRDGDGSDMEEDGVRWYFTLDERPVVLGLLQDSSWILGSSAILSLNVEAEL